MTAQEIYQAFLQDIQQQSSDFAWIQTPFPQPLLSKNTPFLGVVIGGSGVTIARMWDTDQGLDYEIQTQISLPHWTSISEMAEYIGEHLSPDIAVVALNFAFPISSFLRDKKLDATLIRSTKSGVFHESIDTPIGQTCEQIFQEHVNRHISVSLANDTSCLLLAGQEQAQTSDILGLIVGTGFNMAFLDDQSHLINLESGNMSNLDFPQTTHYIDIKSHNPGAQLFEKTVAGYYLYQHYNYQISEELKAISSTQELSYKAQYGNPEEQTLAQTLLQQSATYVAAHLAALAEYRQYSEVSVMAEGSLIIKGYQYQDMVSKIYHTLTPIPLTWYNHEQSSLLGCAKLVV